MNQLARGNGKPKSRNAAGVSRLTNPRTDERTNPSVSYDGVGSAFLASVNQSPSPFAAPMLHDGV